jgi:SSS family solute:Na+ symporter
MATFSLTPLDTAIIVAEILLAVAVGLWAARRVEQTSRGFFLASGRMPWWLIGAAFVSTSVSSEQIVGTVGAAYKYGLGIANWEWWCLPTYLLVMVFFIPLYLRNRITTVPELLNRRFGPACGNIYSYVMLAGYVFVFMAPILYGGSVTFSKLTGWPPAVVLIGIAVLVGLYTMLGGLGSVMWADALQCVLLVLGGVVLFFAALSHIPGGWSAMVQAAPERFHLYHPPADPQAPFLGLITATFGVFLFYQSTNQVMIQRILAARSTWDGLMGLTFAGFINLLRPLVTCLLGLVVYHWIEQMGRAPSLLPDQQDRVFPFALEVFAPSGLRGIILAGFISAVMSSVSALANAVGTIFSLEVYHRVWNRQADDRQLIRAGRIATGAGLILASLAAPLVQHVGIFKYFQTGVTYMATPFISVMLLGIFWKRTNYAGAVAGLLGGLAIQIALALLVWGLGLQLHWLYVGTIAQALTMVLIVAVTLSTQPAAPPGYEALLWEPALLGHYDEGQKRPWYQRVKLWFGLYFVLWAAVYWWFW